MMYTLTLVSGMTSDMLRDDLEEFIEKDISPAEVPYIDAIKLRVALQNILDADKVTDEENQIKLAKNEIKFLNMQLYTEYKKVKQLRNEVIYLEHKISKREQELEQIAQKLLNKSVGYRYDDEAALSKEMKGLFNTKDD